MLQTALGLEYPGYIPSTFEINLDPVPNPKATSAKDDGETVCSEFSDS